MIELEIDCSRCEGKGTLDVESLNSSPRKVFCSDCNGTGKQPSEEGNKLLDFITKYLIADTIRLYKRR